MSEANTKVRLQRLASATRVLIGGNTPATPTLAWATDELDVDVVLRTGDQLRSGLLLLETGSLHYVAWGASTAYFADAVVEPLTTNGYRYSALADGTSAATEPTWPTVIGEVVADGTLTWECLGKLPLGMWDDAFGQWQVEMGTLLPVTPDDPTPPVWWWYVVNDGRMQLTPTMIGTLRVIGGLTPGGISYRLISIGSGNQVATNEPNWQTSGYTIDSLGNTWTPEAPFWAPSTAYAQGHVLLELVITQPVAANQTADLLTLTCTTAGVSGATYPDFSRWPAGEVTADGSAVWTSAVQNVGINAPTGVTGARMQRSAVSEYYARWQSMMRDSLAAAGLDLVVGK